MIDPLVQIRKLTTILIISGTLNIFLLVFLFYWTFKETVPTPYFELKPASSQEQQLPLAIDHSNSEVIRYLRILPMEQLIKRLDQTQLIENGYTLRDLALACLVDIHHFDLGRALIGYAQPDQKRSLVYGKRRNGQNAELIIYPGLSDKQFKAIIDFAATERWPLTSQGLFIAMQKQKNPPSSLFDAFYMTQEFLTVELLFSRAEASLQKKELLDVLLQGDWNMLSNFVEQQRMHQDLSAAHRQRFLLNYIQNKSNAAALLMLKTDGAVAMQRLDDNQVIAILKLLEGKSDEAEKFAKALLTSPRSDDVWKAAAERLYGYAGESMPEQYHHHAALTRFATNSLTFKPNSETITFTPPPVKELPKTIKAEPMKQSPKKFVVNNVLPPAMRTQRQQRVYVVQDGDSLWKIAKRFNVDVEKIRSNNRLESDFLKPGRPLIIP